MTRSYWAATASLLVGAKTVETRALTGSGAGRAELGDDIEPFSPEPAVRGRRGVRWCLHR